MPKYKLKLVCHHCSKKFKKKFLFKQEASKEEITEHFRTDMGYEFALVECPYCKHKGASFIDFIE